MCAGCAVRFADGAQGPDRLGAVRGPSRSFYFSVEGRVDRSTWWLELVAPVGGLSATVYMLDRFVGLSGGLLKLWLVAAAWAAVCVTARRWHDRDKSGWWSLLGLIPVVGPLWIIVSCGLLPGTRRPNRYGPPPVARR